MSTVEVHRQITADEIAHAFEEQAERSISPATRSRTG